MASSKRWGLEEAELGDLCLLAFAIVMLIAGLLSVRYGWRILAWTSLVLIDEYLLLILFISAFRSDKDPSRFLRRYPRSNWLYPRRPAAVLFVLLLVAAVITGFAGLYMDGYVFEAVNTPIEAFHASFLTLGFEDLSPQSAYGKGVVLYNLANSVLLLIGLFPLLIARISTF